MQRKTTIIPKAPLARILLNANAKRVSDPALDRFSAVLEEISIEIGKVAVEMANHAGRKTIHEEDIKIAKNKVFGR